jgi:VWFA-related protein
MLGALLAGAPSGMASGHAAHPAQGAADGQTAPARFRTEANFVRVDVYPTAEGRAVRDLTQDDFELFEDGKPQKIATFEYVQVRGAGQEDARYEPTSVDESLRIAEQGRGRLFVIFLDTYHIDYGGSHRVQRPLVNLLNRIIGPDDMFAVMTPDMSAADITFARKTGTVAGYLSKYWFWGQRERLYPDDPSEQEYIACYGARDSGNAGVATELIRRRREHTVLTALDDLTKFLRGVREERKAVIAITGGWVLFRPNLGVTRNGQSEVPRVGVTPEGKLVGDVEKEYRGAATNKCEADRIMLSQIDDFEFFHELLDDANRANVSFYPVNAMGLEAFDRPIDDNGPTEGEVQALGVRAHRGEDPFFPGGNPLVVNDAMIAQRTDTLESLAGNTDGLAVVNTNNIDAGIRRIVDDLSAYYLLGYYSNGKLDGKYRAISVKVRRRGVDVRARRGYRAATEGDVDAGRGASAAYAVQSPSSAVQAALSALAAARPGLPLRTAVGYAAGGNAQTAARLWALAELDSQVARQDEWIGGGTVDVALTAPDGNTIASKSVRLAAGERAIAVDLGQVTSPATGELLVTVRVRPTGDALPYRDTIHLGTLAAPGKPLVLRRGLTSGIRYVPTADLQFRRAERVRVDLPVAGAATNASAELLDRTGKAMALPVRTDTRTDGDQAWVSAETALAPLAPGDYLIRLRLDVGGQGEEIVQGFRVVP